MVKETRRIWKGFNISWRVHSIAAHLDWYDQFRAIPSEHRDNWFSNSLCDSSRIFDELQQKFVKMFGILLQWSLLRFFVIRCRIRGFAHRFWWKFEAQGYRRTSSWTDGVRTSDGVEGFFQCWEASRCQDWCLSFVQLNLYNVVRWRNASHRPFHVAFSRAPGSVCSLVGQFHVNSFFLHVNSLTRSREFTYTQNYT